MFYLKFWTETRKKNTLYVNKEQWTAVLTPHQRSLVMWTSQIHRVQNQSALILFRLTNCLESRLCCHHLCQSIHLLKQLNSSRKICWNSKTDYASSIIIILTISFLLKTEFGREKMKNNSIAKTISKWARISNASISLQNALQLISVTFYVWCVYFIHLTVHICVAYILVMNNLLRRLKNHRLCWADENIF